MTSANVRNAIISLREMLPEGGPEGDEALIWWLFEAPGLEDAFGGALHEELVETRFVDPVEMEEFRQKLRTWVDAQKPTACLCYLLEDSRYHGYSDTQLYLAKMDRIARKSPWMALWRCRLCEESWFVWDRNDDGDYGIEHASAGDVSKALERDLWPQRSAQLWDDGEVVSLVDGPYLEEWLRNKGYESLEAWRTRNGAELGTDERAPLASRNNRDDILRSSRCFCWNCSARFEPAQISSWTDRADNSGIEHDRRRTAACPECGRDAVLGDAGPLSIDEAPFDKTKPKSAGLGLDAAIERLYEVFEGYSVADLSSLSLYEYGPSAGQLAVLSKHPLRELPEEAVWSMHFFGSMVEEAELKCFLPRILEVLSQQNDPLTYSGASGLFVEQLHGVLDSRTCPDEERDALYSWALEVVDFHLHRRWDINLRCALPTLVAAVLEMGLSAETLVGGLTDPEGALALNETDDGQELLLLDARIHSKDKAVLEELEKAWEGILQWQLGAIDDEDAVWAAIDQLPEEAIPADTRRRLFCHEVVRFQRWAATQTQRGAEWETEYEDWAALRLATKRALGLPYIREIHELLYVLARDNETELVLELLDQHPEHGMRLARDGLRYDDRAARWQLAVFLGRQSSDEAQLLLQEYLDDSDDYVRRRARLASAAQEARPIPPPAAGPSTQDEEAALPPPRDEEATSYAPPNVELASSAVRDESQERPRWRRLWTGLSWGLLIAVVMVLGAVDADWWVAAPTLTLLLMYASAVSVAGDDELQFPPWRHESFVLVEISAVYLGFLGLVWVGLEYELGGWFTGSILLLLAAYLFHLLVVRRGMLKGR